MKYFSAFSGIGGFELGIQKAYESNIKQQHIREESKQEECSQGRMWSAHKHNEMLCSPDGTTPLCIGYSETDKYAIKTYEKHFPEHKNFGDITKINAKELPDFDLLVGGFPCQTFSIAGKRKGFNDTRGTLFFDVARILKEKQPRNFILENVKGLISHEGGRTFKTIISTLAELGYCVEWQVLNAKNFGVPQNRERVFIVGHLGRIPGQKVFPIRNPSEVYNQSNETEKEIYNIASAHNVYVNRIRRLTPIECERLQGFPDGLTDGISDTQRYKQCGNAVVSNVVAEIVKKLAV